MSGRDSATPATSAERIAVCISREIRDGDVVGLGLGTLLPAAGALLAQRRHAPRSVFFLSPAGAYVRRVPMLTVSLAEWSVTGELIDRPHIDQVFTHELHADHVEFFRPAQIDAHGRFNATTIGPPAAPTMRLPGAAGIPDVTAVFDRLYYYVPRHDTRCFVPTVDFVSGGGVPGASRPHRVFTDLGVFGFGADGRMRALSLHEGVTPADVAANTGFPVPTDGAGTTEPPTAEELALLRGELDPLGVLDLETLPSRERRARLVEVYHAERAELAKRMEGGR